MPGDALVFSRDSELGRHTDSRDDDYQDYTNNQLDVAFSRRSFFRFGFDFIRGHDPRGSTDRTISNHPDKYQLVSPNAMYAFGAPGAQGRVELYWTDGYKTYMNNRATTATGDRDTRDLGTAFYWRVMPKTYVLLDLRDTDVNYRSSASTFSSEEKRYYLGVTWDATAATSGTFKVGRLKKDFDTGGRQSYSGTGWEGQITWSPRTYSTLDFYTARTANEQTGLGDFILSDIYGVSWNHSWTSVLTTGVNVRTSATSTRDSAGPTKRNPRIEGRIQIPPLAHVGRGIHPHQSRLQPEQFRVRQEPLPVDRYCNDVASRSMRRHRRMPAYNHWLT
jgi:hypothetical protein